MTFYFSLKHTCSCNFTTSDHFKISINQYKPKWKLTLSRRVGERSGILRNLLEPQPPCSPCVLPPPACCPLKHVESRSLKPSYLFFWRLHPSLLELCNTRGFGAEKRSHCNDTPTQPVCVLWKSFWSIGSFTIISLSPVISAVKWYWGNCTEILPSSIRTGAFGS